MDLANLTTSQLTLIAVAGAIIIIAIAAFAIYRKRRTANLRSKFGDTEYDRAIESGSNRSKAEAELEQRAKRVEKFHVRPLSSADRTRFLESWGIVQTRFVDGPAGAVADADRLLGDVMSARGYPVTNFDQRAADISVDHPLVLENYRTAHAIAVRQTQGTASTEDLRQAMVHYRSLFDELVNEPALPLTA